MDVDKPSHPCELEPHIQTVMKDRGLSVKIRTFLVRSLPENYPYRLSKAGMVAGGATQIPFLEIHGMGLPTEYPDFGIAGDVYLDLKHPGAYACYSKSSSQWVQWDPVASCGARDILVSDLTPHPHFTAERFLWCDETSVGWHRHEIIKTMQRQMHRHGLYERGENVDNNTHSSNVAAKILKVVITATNNKQTQKGEIQEGDSEVVAAEKKIRDIRTRKIPPALATDPTEPSISSSFSRAGTSETSNSTPSIYPVIHSGPHTTAQNEISYAHRVQEQVRNLIAENKMLKNASSNRLFTDAGTSTEVFDSSGSGSASLSPRVLSIFAESISSKQVLESLGNELNEARIETKQTRMAMVAEHHEASLIKSQATEQLSLMSKELEKKEELRQNANDRALVLNERLFSALDELSEAKSIIDTLKRKNSELSQQIARAKAALG